MLRTGECVLNLPSGSLAAAVDRLTFQKLYGLGPQVHPSTLARIPERLYRGLDIERAREVPAI
jgi:hypothetical protein